MSDSEILQILSRILSDVLARDSIELTAETVREDVPGWDSFNNVSFIVAVELEFDIKFSVADMESFANVGEIVEEIKVLQNT